MSSEAGQPQRLIALVRSIRARVWSRNRYFTAHAAPEAATARRLNRYLIGIERDLTRASDVAVEHGDDETTLRMRFDALHSTRVVRLRAAEYSLLCESPMAAARLVR